MQEAEGYSLHSSQSLDQFAQQIGLLTVDQSSPYLVRPQVYGLSGWAGAGYWPSTPGRATLRPQLAPIGVVWHWPPQLGGSRRCTRQVDVLFHPSD